MRTRPHRQRRASRFSQEKRMRTEHIHGYITERPLRTIRTFLPHSAMFFLRFQTSPIQSSPEKTLRLLSIIHQQFQPEALLPLREQRAIAPQSFRCLRLSALITVRFLPRASLIAIPAEAPQHSPIAQASSLIRFTQSSEAISLLQRLCSLLRRFSTSFQATASV